MKLNPTLLVAVAALLLLLPTAAAAALERVTVVSVLSGGYMVQSATRPFEFFVLSCVAVPAKGQSAELEEAAKAELVRLAPPGSTMLVERHPLLTIAGSAYTLKKGGDERGVHINLRLVELGLAFHDCTSFTLFPSTCLVSTFRDAEDRARDACLGVWSVWDGAIERPWRYTDPRTETPQDKCAPPPPPYNGKCATRSPTPAMAPTPKITSLTGKLSPGPLALSVEFVGDASAHGLTSIVPLSCIWARGEAEQRAKWALIRIVPGGSHGVLKGVDVFGMRAARVFVVVQPENGAAPPTEVNVALEVVARGYAFADCFDMCDPEPFLEAEAAARDNCAGFWANWSPDSPSQRHGRPEVYSADGLHCPKLRAPSPQARNCSLGRDGGPPASGSSNEKDWASEAESPFAAAGGSAAGRAVSVALYLGAFCLGGAVVFVAVQRRDDVVGLAHRLHGRFARMRRGVAAGEAYAELVPPSPGAAA